MKRFNRFCAGLLASLVLTGPVQAELESWQIDPEHATVAFLVDHLGYAATLGRFTELSGSFEYDSDTQVLANLEVSIATESVQTDHKARDKHLRSKDFLDVKSFPEMRYEGSTLTMNEDGSGQLEGTLTLLGESRPLVLNITINQQGVYPFGHKLPTIGVSARGSLNRSDFGMNYGVAEAMVGDAVALIIELEANQR